ncbi:MAG: caspase family protein [Elusimicrobia bacterium]|nr:caspase family protein [Elusimicrobiota bacterium]
MRRTGRFAAIFLAAAGLLAACLTPSQLSQIQSSSDRPCQAGADAGGAAMTMDALTAELAASNCRASLQPLRYSPPPSAIKALEPLKRRIPSPLVVAVEAEEKMPSWGGRFTFPLKRCLEKAFSDAGAAAFASDAAAGDYAFTMKVQALSSQLRENAAGGAEFQADLNVMLHDPDGKLILSKNYSGSAQSAFDKAVVPEAVWSASYRLAGEFLSQVRDAPWLRGALNPRAPAGADRARIQAMIDSAVKAPRDEPEINSDVDEPVYRLAKNPDDFALVIGIEKYANLPAADYAERDAQAMRSHLLALGYPERNILFLKGSQAVRSGITKYVESWLPKNVNKNSRVFFYFSGHGAPDAKTGRAYLVPWDGDPKFLDDTAYPVKRLYEKLNALPAKSVLVALDSCFSGAGGRSVIPKGARPLVTHVEEGGIPAGKLEVFAAADGDEITGTDPAQGHGLFTYYFLKGLNEKNGAASAKSLYDYLAPHVADSARRENRDQTPQLLGGVPDAPLK